jgi:uncharacterized protein YjbI with pentapeptide repeats
MSTILTISSVETLMRMNSIPSNSEDSYNNKIDKLKNAGLLMKNIQYTNEPEKINTPESDRLAVNRTIIIPSGWSGGNVIKYDQLISGDINITFNNDLGIYTITFLRNNPFTIYQIWSDTDNTINQTRNVRQLDAVSWIDTVFNITKNFTPTAIMDTATERYIFIIKKVYINNNNKLVFETPGTGIIFQGCISTYLSNNLPLGTLMNVRFDIDAVSDSIVDYSNQSFIGYDFSNQNLTGLNFNGVNLTNANFTNTNCTGVDFFGANLTGANLTRANFTNAILTNAIIKNANMFGATLSGANLTGANLTNANLMAAYLTGPPVTLAAANLTGANLTGANLTGANLTNTNLTEAYVKFANLTNANFTNTNCTGVDFFGTILIEANFTGVSLTQTQINVIAEWGVIV